MVLQRSLAFVLLLVACEQRGPELESVTTIPARVSSSSEFGESGGAEAEPDAALAHDAGALLHDPAAIDVAHLGYAGAPAPLSEAAQRRHASGNLALGESHWERAIAAFRGVLAEHPDSAQDYRDLALAHVGNDELELAAAALAEALVREFPHAWHDYLHDPGFDALRAGSHHAQLEQLAARLRSLHERARIDGTPTTVTWSPRNAQGRATRGAQAGVTIAKRFVPLAPRVWSTTARDDASLHVDAYFDPGSNRVVNVNATAHAGLDAVVVQVHDAITGRVIAHRQLEGGGKAAFEIDAAGLRVRELGEQPWLDLRGRRSAAQDEPSGAVVVVRATGIALAAHDDDVQRVAWTG